MDAERGLMERVAKGDQGAFSDLAQRYSGKLLAVAGRLLGSRADAEDAVQRAFLQCYAGAAATTRAGPSPRGSTASSPTCAWTSCGAAPPAPPTTSARPPGRSSSSNHRPPDAYLDLHRAFERVPREARVLLALRYVDGLSYGELARIRGITINTVKSQLARGKALLRDELGKRGAGHD